MRHPLKNERYKKIIHLKFKKEIPLKMNRPKNQKLNPFYKNASQAR